MSALVSARSTAIYWGSALFDSSFVFQDSLEEDDDSDEDNM